MNTLVNNGAQLVHYSLHTLQNTLPANTMADYSNLRARITNISLTSNWPGNNTTDSCLSSLILFQILHI